MHGITNKLESNRNVDRRNKANENLEVNVHEREADPSTPSD